MKHKNSVVALLLVLMLSAFAYATPRNQPNMQSARENLQNAKANLLVGEHNKGGHRAKAINLINSAIAETNRGINFARKDNHTNGDASSLLDQPHMEAALSYLKNAKSDLERATNDKGDTARTLYG